MEFIRFTSVLGLLIPYTIALQVTPNSPCASFCQDSEGTDHSDPNSSTTTNKDITCLDSKYTSTLVGQKFQRCLTCLQDSTFSQGSENDQLWFLYNLRYTFDNCIFGFPNAIGVPSTPCSTSTACGALEEALTTGDLKPTNPDYSYCDANGGFAASSVATCRSCLRASEDQGFLVNYLVALEAGCEQRPSVGTALGLSDTVFSATEINIIDPVSTKSEGSQALPITTIVGIAVGGVVGILAVAGIFYVCFRKRRNRRLRLEGTTPKAIGSKRGHHRRTSSLSFRCQTHLTPRSPEFPNSAMQEERRCSNPLLALGSHPPDFGSTSSWTPPASWQRQSTAQSFSRAKPTLQPLQSISITAPTVPSNVHYSTSPRSSQFSVHEEVPTSTTSTQSTARLLPLRSYNPAEYGVSSPQLGSSTDGSYTSPVSGTTASPLLSRGWDRHNQDSMSPIWETPQRETIVNTRPKSGNPLERLGVPPSPGKMRLSTTGTPVESKEINTVFPGPPSPGARWRRA